MASGGDVRKHQRPCALSFTARRLVQQALGPQMLVSEWRGRSRRTPARVIQPSRGAWMRWHRSCAAAFGREEELVSEGS
jgi:hypothetical protein